VISYLFDCHRDDVVLWSVIASVNACANPFFVGDDRTIANENDAFDRAMNEIDCAFVIYETRTLCKSGEVKSDTYRERRLGDRVDFDDFFRDLDLDVECRSWSLSSPVTEP
jgi:hypothetical protein